MADRQAKILFPTNSRVGETMLQFFSNVSCIIKYENLALQHIEKKYAYKLNHIRMVHSPAARTFLEVFHANAWKWLDILKAIM